MREAIYYDKKAGGIVSCRLCPKYCVISPGQSGFCRIRHNKDGLLYATGYGRAASCGLDPIEKKPLYHFYPGARILSFGASGCNFHCEFCQNWTTVHNNPETARLTPEKAVSLAVEANGDDAPNAGIAYTYSEPLVWYEFVLETARQARAAGLKNVLVTNGYINETPLKELLPYIDAMNIDVKGFTEGFYRKYCAGAMAPVLRTVEIALEQNCHVELTTLLITGLNDSPEEIQQLVAWTASLDSEIPIHLSRYFPNYKMDLPATSLATLKMAEGIARNKLSYVYLGNAPELGGQNTYCPSCGNLLINRTGYRTQLVDLHDKECGNCGKKINIRL